MATIRRKRTTKRKSQTRRGGLGRLLTFLLSPVGIGCAGITFLLAVIVMYRALVGGDYDDSFGGFGRNYDNDNDNQNNNGMMRRLHGGRNNSPPRLHHNRRTGPVEGGVRQRYEMEHPNLSSGKENGDGEVRQAVEKLRLPHPIGPVKDIENDLQYDVHHCPPEVPDGYPVSWNVLEVLDHWNPDDMDVPTTGIYQGLCVIDWSDHEHRSVAYRYQKAEVPFLIHNHPQIWQAAERWSHYDYVHELVGDDTHRNEHNKDGNHMMYWKLGRGSGMAMVGRGAGRRGNDHDNNNQPDGWTPPTENIELSFPDWYAKALNVEHSSDPIHMEHYYLRLNGAYEHENEYLYDELPFFEPTQKSLFMVDPEEQRGINCRFGSKGIIAETHYDMSRNMILILNGRKRYILAHPEGRQTNKKACLFLGIMTFTSLNRLVVFSVLLPFFENSYPHVMIHRMFEYGIVPYRSSIRSAFTCELVGS